MTLRSVARGRQLQVAYLCLQDNAEGQASFTHVHEIISGLRRRGWGVCLYDATYARSSPSVLARVAKVIGLQLRFALSTPSDVAYLRMHALGVPAVLASMIRRVPIVLEVNGPTSELFLVRPWLRPAQRAIESSVRFQLRRSAAVVAVTENLATWATARGAARVVTIPNGANTDLFRPGLPRPAGLPPRYVAFIGALAPWQGVQTIVDAVEHPDWPKDVSLVIVGDGHERDIVDEAVGRGSRILFLGRVAYDAVPAVAANALAVLSPQVDVGGRNRTGLFPLKVFEGMAAGVPVIVSDTPGQGTLVRATRCGIVVPEGDAGAVAAAVRDLAHDASLAEEMGRRGRAAATEKHSWDRRAADTHELLVDVLRGLL